MLTLIPLSIPQTRGPTEYAPVQGATPPRLNSPGSCPSLPVRGGPPRSGCPDRGAWGFSAQAPRAARPSAAPLIAQLVAPYIAQRLRSEGVVTLKDWRALGRRRHRLFGIVPHVVRELDALAARRRS